MPRKDGVRWDPASTEKEWVKAARSLRRQGKTQVEISRIVGISRSLISDATRDVECPVDTIKLGALKRRKKAPGIISQSIREGKLSLDE